MRVRRTFGGTFSPPGAISQGCALLRLATHNGRGWIGGAAKDAKRRCLIQAANCSDAAGFQETHGTPAQIFDAVQSLQNTHFVFWSSSMFNDAINFSDNSFHVPPHRGSRRCQSGDSESVSQSSSGGDSDSDTHLSCASGQVFLVVQTVRTAVQALPIALQPLMLVSVLAESSAHSDEPASVAALALSRRSGCLAEFLKSL